MPGAPYWIRIEFSSCVMRFVNVSNVQSNKMLVGAQRSRGLSADDGSKPSAAFLPASVSATGLGRDHAVWIASSASDSGVPREPGNARTPCGSSPGASLSATLIGTSAPLMPLRSVITRCSAAQSPLMFGSPFASRSGRFACAAATASARSRWP